MPALEFPDPPLSDGVVVLRRSTDADIPALVEICQNPEISRWTLVPSPYDEGIAREWLDDDEDTRPGTRHRISVRNARPRAPRAARESGEPCVARRRGARRLRAHRGAARAPAGVRAPPGHLLRATARPVVH